MANPQRGEVWIVDLGPVAKIRPALVLSISLLDADRALVTIVPHTTSTRGTRFEISTNTRFLQAGAFDCQNPQTIPLAKCTRRLGSLSEGPLELIEKTLRLWLGL